MRKFERRFRLYPDNAQVFFDVKIFATTKALQAAYDDGDILGVSQPTTCYWIYPSGRERLLPRLGDIWFTQEAIGSAIVAHELTHAAFHYFRWRQEQGFEFKWLGPRVKDGNVSQKEEAFCRVVSTMVIQFWGRYQRIRHVGRHHFPLDPVRIGRWQKPRPEPNGDTIVKL